MWRCTKGDIVRLVVMAMVRAAMVVRMMHCYVLVLNIRNYTDLRLLLLQILEWCV